MRELLQVEDALDVELELPYVISPHRQRCIARLCVAVVVAQGDVENDVAVSTCIGKWSFWSSCQDDGFAVMSFSIGESKRCGGNGLTEA